jgi:hypothetical protein
LYNRIKILGGRAWVAGLATKSDTKTAMIYTVCHELSHLITRYESVGDLDAEKLWNEGGHVENKAGYSRINTTVDIGKKGGKKISKDEGFIIFEEGITDKLAIELFSSYIKAVPNSNEESLRKGNNLLSARSSDGSRYALSRLVLEKFIEKVADKTGFPQEDVWHAILRDKLESSGFDDPELRELVAEAVSDDFLEKLSKAATVKDFHRLVKLLDNPGSPNFISRAKEWLKNKTTNH